MRRAARPCAGRDRSCPRCKSRLNASSISITLAIDGPAGARLLPGCALFRFGRSARDSDDLLGRRRPYSLDPTRLLRMPCTRRLPHSRIQNPGSGPAAQVGCLPAEPPALSRRLPHRRWPLAFRSLLRSQSGGLSSRSILFRSAVCRHVSGGNQIPTSSTRPARTLQSGRMVSQSTRVSVSLTLVFNVMRSRRRSCLTLVILAPFHLFFLRAKAAERRFISPVLSHCPIRSR